MSFEAEYQN